MTVFINLLLYPNMIMMSTNYILINELFGNDKLEIFISKWGHSSHHEVHNPTTQIPCMVVFTVKK